MTDNQFKTDAKDIVDTFFDNRLFKDNVTRDNMVAVEELIAFLLQSRFDGYLRMTKIMNEIKIK